MQKTDCCSRLICRCWSAPTVASCVHYALWRVFVTGRGGGTNVGTEAGMHQYTASFSNMYSVRWKTPFGTIPFGGPRAKKGTVQKVLFFSFPCKKPEPEGLFLQVSVSCWSLCIVCLFCNSSKRQGMISLGNWACPRGKWWRALLRSSLEVLLRDSLWRCEMSL